MAFPQVLSQAAAADSSAGTSHIVSMPATVDANDLLIVFIMTDENTTFTTPGGWTAGASQSDNAPSSRITGFTKVAIGNEDGTTVDFQTAVSSRCEWIVVRISAASWVQDLVGTAFAGATPSSNDPPNLTPSWGALDTLWFALVANDGDTDSSGGTLPTNYTNGLTSNANYGLVNHFITISRRELNAASENPGAYGNTTNYAWTIAIQPAAAGGSPFRARRTNSILGTRMGSRSL